MVDQPGKYAIHIQEQLGSLSSAFEDMVIFSDESGTRLIGDFPDQAALHGVLARIRDLCLTLVSVEQLDTKSDS
ncbi:MAG: hypothetical protein KME04_15045 [Pleurocapsa minor GSE-CHR-MK-17-07R]|jgi:hypothetical protein|nr:hypothetical protein [Pleurocapsa minor GSE-CHR-MK 17-07R]